MSKGRISKQGGVPYTKPRITPTGPRQLVDWINTLFGTDYTSLSQTSNGVEMCRLFETKHPGLVPMFKVNLVARTEYERIRNFKILQRVWNKLELDIHVDVERAVAGKEDELFRLWQRLRQYFDEHSRESLSVSTFSRNQEVRSGYGKESKNGKVRGRSHIKSADTRPPMDSLSMGGWPRHMLSRRRPQLSPVPKSTSTRPAIRVNNSPDSHMLGSQTPQVQCSSATDTLRGEEACVNVPERARNPVVTIAHGRREHQAPSNVSSSSTSANQDKERGSAVPVQCLLVENTAKVLSEKETAAGKDLRTCTSAREPLTAQAVDESLKSQRSIRPASTPLTMFQCEREGNILFNSASTSSSGESSMVQLLCSKDLEEVHDHQPLRSGSLTETSRTCGVLLAEAEPSNIPENCVDPGAQTVRRRNEFGESNVDGTTVATETTEIRVKQTFPETTQSLASGHRQFKRSPVEAIPVVALSQDGFPNEPRRNIQVELLPVRQKHSLGKTSRSEWAVPRTINRDQAEPIKNPSISEVQREPNCTREVRLPVNASPGVEEEAQRSIPDPSPKSDNTDVLKDLDEPLFAFSSFQFNMRRVNPLIHFIGAYASDERGGFHLTSGESSTDPINVNVSSSSVSHGQDRGLFFAAEVVEPSVLASDGEQRYEDGVEEPNVDGTSTHYSDQSVPPPDLSRSKKSVLYMKSQISSNSPDGSAKDKDHPMKEYGQTVKNVGSVGECVVDVQHEITKEKELTLDLHLLDEELKKIAGQ